MRIVKQFKRRAGNAGRDPGVLQCRHRVVRGRFCGPGRNGLFDRRFMQTPARARRERGVLLQVIAPDRAA